MARMSVPQQEVNVPDDKLIAMADAAMARYRMNAYRSAGPTQERAAAAYRRFLVERLNTRSTLLRLSINGSERARADADWLWANGDEVDMLSDRLWETLSEDDAKNLIAEINNTWERYNEFLKSDDRKKIVAGRIARKNLCRDNASIERRSREHVAHLRQRGASYFDMDEEAFDEWVWKVHDKFYRNAEMQISDITRRLESEIREGEVAERRHGMRV